MEVSGCAKRDRPVKSDGCVRLRGQKIKGIEGLGVSILLQCEISRYFGKALYGTRSLSLQVNHGSLVRWTRKARTCGPVSFQKRVSI